MSAITEQPPYLMRDAFQDFKNEEFKTAQLSINGLQDDMHDVKADIQELQHDMRDVKADIQVLQQDMREVKQDIQEMKLDISDLRGEIRIISHQVTTLTKSFNTYKYILLIAIVVPVFERIMTHCF